jgi:hypothetical protein
MLNKVECGDACGISNWKHPADSKRHEEKHKTERKAGEHQHAGGNRSPGGGGGSLGENVEISLRAES